jgi:hypothetical protein
MLYITGSNWIAQPVYAQNCPAIYEEYFPFDMGITMAFLDSVHVNQPRLLSVNSNPKPLRCLGLPA